MKNVIIPLCIALFTNLIFGQNPYSNIDMIPSNWEVPEGAVFEAFDNRKTLVLPNGRATVKNLAFSNGSIEVDIYSESKRSFGGITFRKIEDKMEEVYLRQHKSSQVDAVQYTPIFNNESNWQLYRELQAKVTFKTVGWNTLRINVINQMAEVYVNGDEVLTIDYLRTEHNKGSIGLWALFGSRFSNFRVSTTDSPSQGITMEKTSVDVNIINEWNITDSFVYEEGQLKFDDFSKKEYSVARTEESGLLPISKYVKKKSSGNFEQNKEDYIVASKTIQSTNEEVKLFSFDYSDKIIVYLNGVPIFSGNNSFRQKGVQYMGHLNIDTNKLFLPLKKGQNTIHCVVIDKANGWGLMGKIE